MALRDNCDKLEPEPIPIADIAQELENILTENTYEPEAETVTTAVDDKAERKAERILVSRQEIRRSAYVQQLIKDARNAIFNISNLRVDLENETAENLKDAVALLQGKESDVLARLRQVLTSQLDDPKQIDKYLEYVKNLL
jgi:DNA integrity scanning protein DisA with diadenylate cyclase activity